MSDQKFFVCGHARHGKDTFAEMVWGKVKSSSVYVCEEWIFPQLKDVYGYKTSEECFQDRVNHRSEWFDLIRAFNRNDPAKLARLIFSESPVYCGIRSRVELEAYKAENPDVVVIWVDRSLVLPPEPDSSNEILPIHADVSINNNFDLEWLTGEVEFFKSAYLRRWETCAH